MGRAHLKDLKNSTLLTFFEICKEWGLKKDLDYKYNSSAGIISWSNGSEVYLKDLFAYPSDPEFDSLGSTEYTLGFIDEASEVTFKAKDILTSRLRFKLDEFGLIPKLLIGTNPCKHWAYFDFYKPSVVNKLLKYRKFLKALVTDNPKISKHYIANLKKLDKNSKERLLYGNWDYDSDPLRLFEYDSIIDMFTNDAERGLRYCIVDVAGFGRDKTVIGIWEGFFLVEVIIKDNVSSKELDEILIERKIPRSKCAVDEVGVGFGLVKDLSGVKGFVANARPIEKKGDIKEVNKVTMNYKNLKSQCWFECANYVNAGKIGIYKGISSKAKEMLIEDLQQIKQKDADKDTPLRVETKEEVKERLGRSTDIGDMIMMRMYFKLKASGGVGFWV